MSDYAEAFNEHMMAKAFRELAAGVHFLVMAGIDLQKALKLAGLDDEDDVTSE
ncbi:hypothetical protein [Streptomyces sp. NPDC055085]